MLMEGGATVGLALRPKNLVGVDFGTTNLVGVDVKCFFPWSSASCSLECGFVNDDLTIWMVRGPHVCLGHGERFGALEIGRRDHRDESAVLASGV